MDEKLVEKGSRKKVHNREELKKLLRTARNRRILHMPMEQMRGLVVRTVTERIRKVMALLGYNLKMAS